MYLKVYFYLYEDLTIENERRLEVKQFTVEKIEKPKFSVKSCYIQNVVKFTNMYVCPI